MSSSKNNFNNYINQCFSGLLPKCPSSPVLSSRGSDTGMMIVWEGRLGHNDEECRLSGHSAALPLAAV